MAIGDNPRSGLPADSGGPQPATPNRPSGQPDAAAAPDAGTPDAVANAGASSPLGGGPAQPAKPGVGARVASFISGGQGTPGSVWRGILSGALTGMVAGAGQGHVGQGVQAGGAAQQKAAQVKTQQEQEQERIEGERKLQAAQTAEINHRIVDAAWTASAQKAKATQEQAALENNLAQEATKSGGQDLGVVRDPNDLVALHKANPNLPQDAARGNILTIPHYTEKDGQLVYDGARAFYVKPDWSAAKIDHDITYPMFVPSARPNEAGHWEERTLQKGTVTNAEAAKTQMEQSAQAAKYDNDQTISKAQQAAANAQLALAKSASTQQEAANLKEQATQGGQQLVEGDMAMSQMGRMSPKLKAATLAEANRISLAQTGHLFNAEDNEAFYKDKQGTLKSFTSGEDASQITAFNTAIAHLGELADAAKAMNNGNLEPLNALAAELSQKTGSPVPATYAAVHAAVTGEVGSVYKKGAPSEGEINRLEGTFNRSQSPDAANAAIGETVNLMMGKLTALDNKFRNGTRGKSPGDYGINLISPESAQTLQNFNIQVPQRLAGTVGGTQTQAPAGQVWVQLPGQAPAFIPKDKLAEFKKDNPNASVRE